MGTGMTILVGTIGQGVMRSADSGETWDRVRVRRGLHSDALARCLAVHPHQPNIVFAGTDRGLYRTGDGGETWELLESPMNNYYTWSLAIDPVEPEVMFAGTGTPTPAAIFRSTDGGKSWEKRPMDVAATCSNVGVPRVTAIAIDPEDRRNIWVSLEVDGARRSTDRGDTWTNVDFDDRERHERDVHNMLVTHGPGKAIFVVGNREIYASTDDGTTWQPLDIQGTIPWKSPGPYTYIRGIAAQPGNPRTIFLAIGDSTPGSTGAVLRSKDKGKSWQTLPLPVQPNSSMWTLGVSSVNPDIIFAASRFGYLYRSDNGGDSWIKLGRELSEIAAVRWIPN